MEFEIKKDEIFDALIWTTRFLFTSAKAAPTTTSIEIKTKENKIILNSANLETNATCEKEAKILQEGTKNINGRALFEIVKLLPETTIKIKSDDKKTEITTAKTLHTIPNIQTEVNKQDDKNFKKIGKIKTVEIIEALNQTAVAVSKEETAQILTAANIKIDEKTFTTTTIDRYRTAKKITKIKESTKEEIIIKHKTLQTIVTGLEKSENVNIEINKELNKVKISTENKKAITSLVAGEFPNTEQLFKEKYKKNIKIDRQEFFDAIVRTAVLNEAEGGIFLNINKNTITVKNENVDAFSTEEIPCDYQGEEFKIKFNPAYLKEGLSQIKEKDVIFKVEEPQKPVEIIGYISDKEVENDDYKYVIVPIREV